MHETNSAIADALVDAARELSARVERLDFAAPVSHRYNPLNYAWAPHELYPVSYTHLDVYKRQNPTCVIRATSSPASSTPIPI